MPDPGATDRSNLQRDGRISSLTALRSTMAGLVAIFLLSLTFATFGPAFNLAVGYGLMIAAIPAALLGLWWADRAAHEVQRNPTLTNGVYAKSGAALSIAALFLSTYYTGFLVFILVFWPLVWMGVLVVYAFHRASVTAKAAQEAGA